MESTLKNRHAINRLEMPQTFPTNLQTQEFWEQLGRTVACFGFLEHTIKKAILAFSARKLVSEEEIDNELELMNGRLQHALHSPLLSLTELFEKTVKENNEGNDELIKIAELTGALRMAADVRNAICHASWNSRPDETGSSIPFFAHKKFGTFDTPVNKEFLIQTQAHVRDLIYDVMDSVTVRGWQFPGSNGPGQDIWSKLK